MISPCVPPWDQSKLTLIKDKYFGEVFYNEH